MNIFPASITSPVKSHANNPDLQSFDKTTMTIGIITGSPIENGYYEQAGKTSPDHTSLGNRYKLSHMRAQAYNIKD